MGNFSSSHSFTPSLKHSSEVPSQISEQNHLRDNPVIQVCKAIRAYVEDFERSLDGDHEVGIRLASFGGVAFHAQQIGFSMPNVITFSGNTEDGEKVQLIQHVSQTSFLLRAVRKQEAKPKRIGFLWKLEE
ncbi:MAG: hypothetical protein JO218_06825 [Burkholderiales bacterium]|nr:hypothetical protein [Burkholderiales bacterium]